MIWRIFRTTWSIIYQLVRGIDLQLKNEKTPAERIMWWGIVLLIVLVIGFFVFLQVSAFLNTVVNTTGVVPGEELPAE